LFCQLNYGDGRSASTAAWQCVLLETLIENGNITGLLKAGASALQPDYLPCPVASIGRL